MYMEAFHSQMNHPGRDSMLSYLAKFAYWPRMNADVTEHVASCLECLFHKKHATRHGPSQPPSVGRHPWDIVICDILELPESREGYTELLVFCDNLSRFVEAIPFKTLPNSEQVLDAFVTHILCRYGTPNVLRSDRGSNLISKLSQQFYELCGVELETSTSHHHKGLPSAVERFHSTLLGLTRASAGEHPGDWMDMLPFVLFSYRATTNRVTSLSPAELLYGRNLTPPYPGITLAATMTDFPKTEAVLKPYCQTLMQRLRISWDLARQATQEQQLYNKVQFDSTHRVDRPLKEGDQVLLHEPGAVATTSKLTRGLAWSGPYRVHKLLKHNNVLLRDLPDKRMHPVVHIERLRLYNGESQGLSQDQYVIDKLLNVRRVSPEAARGVSRLEFLVKWRQYRASEATWEPMETLIEDAEDLVKEFMHCEARHPVLRAYKKEGIDKTRKVKTPDSRDHSPPPTTTSSPASTPRSQPVLELPVAAKFERGLWYYRKDIRRSNGRIASRWMPASAYTQDEEQNLQWFRDLRAEYLLSCPPEQVALVTAVCVINGIR